MMKNQKVPAFCSCILGLCMLVFLICPFTAFAETQTGLDIQLVADQTTVSPGGEASLHLLVYNNGTEPMSNVNIDLVLPPGLELSAAGSAVWNAELRQLQWNLKNIPAGSAAAFDFNLRMGADVQTGMPLEIVGAANSDAGLSIKIAGVQLKPGTQTDQPFFKGYPDRKFHPESDLTRAEAAAVIARIKNLELKPDQPVHYSDIPESHWAYTYIVKVTQEGYMEGSDGKFRPDEPITRAEMVALILRLRGVHPIPLTSFSDLEGSWAKDAVGTAKSLHMVDGMATSFDPNRFLRRDEAAKLIDIGLSRGPLVDGETKVIQHFPDVDRSNWAFGWIEEASVVAHEGEYHTLGEESLIRYLPEQTEPL